jgi:hypothetical protein
LLVGGKVTFNLDQGTLLIGNSTTDYHLYFDGTNLKLVGSNYSFDGSTFTLGKTGDTAKHTKDYSQYTHTDGTSTKISADGLQHINGITKKTYHYLTYKGAATIANYEKKTITLPDEFKGKDFTVTVTIKSYDCDGTFLTNQGLQSTENHTNGTFDVTIWIVKATQNADGVTWTFNQNGNVDIEYIVIA